MIGKKEEMYEMKMERKGKLYENRKRRWTYGMGRISKER